MKKERETPMSILFKRYNMYRLLTLISLSLIVFACNSKVDLKLQSPGQNTIANLSINESSMSLDLIFNDDTLVSNLQLGLSNDEKNLFQNIQVIERMDTTFKQKWETVNGKNKSVLNHYNGFVFKLKNVSKQEFNLELKLYDKGFAYRFLFPEGYNTIEENSIIHFSDDYTFWTYNGEDHNVGPVKLSEYENKHAKNPVTFKTTTQKYFAIHEAAILEHAPFILINQKGLNSFKLRQEINANIGASKTSWRTFILGNKAGDLVESDLLVNLNEPCKIEDTSWIKPGRAMMLWRVMGYKTNDGFEYDINTESQILLIDFAANNNIQHLLLDGNWYGPEFSENSDPASSGGGIDIERCMIHANEKGIGVMLYLNDFGARKFGLERVLKQFSEWGVSGVKYGFLRGEKEEKVLRTRRVIELCAKYKLMLNFHDAPIAPSGDRRTWPNVVTKEFGHAQCDSKRCYFPETIVTVPFVNMLAGPLELGNGYFSLNTASSDGRYHVFQPIPGTVVAEVAKLIAIYGGYFALPDAPEEYLKKDDLFDCIRQMPAHFDGFKVLDGEIGEFISVARQAGDEWFVGSLTNRESRELTIKFDFLEEGKKYTATFYEDKNETHFLNNKEAYQVKEGILIDKNSLVNIGLAPGGGHAIWIRSEE